MILYVETHFLMSIAKGQDSHAPILLQNTPPSVCIAIPSICCKVFLSGNNNDFGKQNVQEALHNAGVDKYFTRTQNFLGWLQSQPSSLVPCQ